MPSALGTAIVLVEAIASLASLVLAGVVLATRPKRLQNRALATLLVFSSLFWFAWIARGPLIFDLYWRYNAFFLWRLSWLGVPIATILFLTTLEAPWPRVVAIAWIRRIALTLLLSLFVWAAVRPYDIVNDDGVSIAYRIIDLNWYAVSLVAFGSLVVCGFVAWRFPRASPQRRQAVILLVAFGVTDLATLASSGTMATLDLIDPRQHELLMEQDWWTWIRLILPPLADLVRSLLLAYGILATQMFDIDLKLKVGFRRGTIVTLVIGVFIVVSVFAQNFVNTQFGLLAGGGATVLLIVARDPLRRLAEIVADHVFPGVSDETEYMMQKKVAVYGEALREAMFSAGGLDPERARTLRKLQTSLGLTQRDHGMLLAALGGAALPRGGAVVAPGVTVLGKYRVERELGAGGGGRAFLATDVRMKRSVALKLISSSDHAAAIREARAAAAIEHPNVVRVYDIEDLGAEALLVMEFVDGGSLKDRLAASGALSGEAFARVSHDMLAALDAVHAAGTVHRDIKPGNVLLTRDGRAKLSDFGIARLTGFETTIGPSVSGSVRYMAPEQARGKRVTALSDLYSAAATLYEARTGRPLVEALHDESAMETQMRVGSGNSARIDDLDPPALRMWFAKALTSAPEGRYQDAEEMRAALAAALEN